LTAPIPLYDVAAANRPHQAALLAAVRRVLDSGCLVDGPELAAFESELAGYLGARHALGVKSGTDAIVLALRALGIGPDDEVITSAFTFYATAEAITVTGATPVFCDVEPETLCLSLNACRAAVTERTRAVLLVHVFGHCADLDRFTDFCSSRGLALVEDAAQAIGSTWRGRRLGTLGRAATFSFYPTKNLGAAGDGGAVVTDDPDVAARVRSLRCHGVGPGGRHFSPGLNSRLDEVQAAALRLGLGRLDGENARRRELAGRYDAALSGLCRLPRGAAGSVSNFHQYAILTPRRDGLAAWLAGRGIGTARYYDTPVHLEPAFRHLGLSLPVTEQAAREVLNLPIRPSLTDEEQARVSSSVGEFLAA